MTTDGVGLEVYGRTDVGRVRANNEDAFVIADLMAPTWTHAMREPVELSVGARGVLLAVSDGMGGAQAGEVASALTLHALRRGMVTVEASGAEAALTASVERANQKVWDAGTASGQKGMGATLTAVLLHGKRAYVAEVGDSRAYVLRGSRLIRLTHDQSCAQLMLDAGALTREEAETFQYKNMVLQAIGVKPHVIVALNRFTLRRGDKVLVLGRTHGQGHGRRDPRHPLVYACDGRGVREARRAREPPWRGGQHHGDRRRDGRRRAPRVLGGRADLARDGAGFHGMRRGRQSVARLERRLLG